MKLLTFIYISLFALSSALAQFEPTGFHDKPDHRKSPPPPDEHLHKPPPGRGAADRWLKQLQKNQPQEFDRLQNLRRTDPKAFRYELHKQLQQQRLLSALRTSSVLYDCYMSLPKEERQRVVAKLFRDDPHKDMRRHERRKDMRQLKKMEQKTRKLAEHYHSAEGNKRPEIEHNLRSELGRVFDMRTEHRLEMIKELEQNLTHLKNKQVVRSENRELIIDQRFKELTTDENLRW